ncbi:MAG: GNAT family N-acetyltransferase [Opitutales bacterium]|nr:GNAT family N-acetyltransferase [Opitutales bacterium]
MPRVDFEYQTQSPPIPDELKTLFKQTSWANERELVSIANMLAHCDLFVTVRLDGKLIGFGRAISDYAYRALLDDIIVDEAHRKQGIGKEIVQKLLEMTNEVEQVFLKCREAVGPFYEALGFTPSNGLTMVYTN